MTVGAWKQTYSWFVVVMALFLTAIVLGVMRVVGFTSEAYQAVAHFFVGGLYGAALTTGSIDFWIPAILVTVIEIVVFLAGAIK